jgi:hypothetical protein
MSGKILRGVAIQHDDCGDVIFDITLVLDK